MVSTGPITTPLQPPLATQETNVPQEIKEMETYSLLLNKDAERRRQRWDTISGLGGGGEDRENGENKRSSD